ncbi:MAG: Potassium channel [Vezdaea acicularis]|nr:MAG: Potassium channel [Vezdaea acicularis]
MSTTSAAEKTAQLEGTAGTDSTTSARNEGEKEGRDPESLKRAHRLWPFRLRPDDDDEPQDWWFASTAIPLLAATTGPMANTLSIAALVTSWRNNYTSSSKEADSIGYPDPHWCIAANAASLACGFIGNFFLLLNFTKRIRYIIALPATIIFWYAATTLLICITALMNEKVPPVAPDQVYSQGFWHAIIAAVLYLVSSMLLMVNMMGYFLGHYPQHFTLTEHQRTLILQTMLFFIWLAGGGAVFAKVCGWRFVDALYFCDVTILTVGFGDYSAPNDAGRGLVFPFSVGGIIILGLMVGSIRRFAMEISHDKVLKHHVEKQRTLTIDRAVSTSIDLRIRQGLADGVRPSISEPFELRERAITFDDAHAAESLRRPKTSLHDDSDPSVPTKFTRRISRTFSRSKREPKVILLREERDRFNAMRAIQRGTRTFKRYTNLGFSLVAFGLLWCVGAAVFMVAEQREQGLSYFEALYFCYVSLLTIGYGDLSPKSNAGKPFFIVWSLIAVPTMTILVSDMGDTVIASFKRGTARLGDWTVLPQAGLWRAFLDKHPWLLLKLQQKVDQHAAKRRLASGFRAPQEDDEAIVASNPTLEQLAAGEPNPHQLARALAIAIRRVADDLQADQPKSYSYEQWVEFTRLIRFSKYSEDEVEEQEETTGIVDWDFIGEDSPMLADETESVWILDRLCESLERYMKRQARESEKLERGMYNGRGREEGRDEIKRS